MASSTIKRSSAFLEISKKLPELDRGELELIRTRIGALLHLGPSAPDLAEEDDPAFLLSALSDVMQSMGLEFTSPAILRKNQAFPSFKEKAPALMKYLRRASNQRQAQRAIFMMGVDLLRDLMSKQGLAISTRTLMAHIHRIPSALNQAFPGYASAGLLHMLIINDARTINHARKKPNRHAV